MNNEVVNEIKKEDKRKLKSFIVILICCFIVGGIAGYMSAMVEDRIDGIQLVAEAAATVIRESSYFFNIVLTILSLIVVIPLYMQCKSMYATWDGEDENTINKIENKLSLAMLVVSVNSILMMIVIIIGTQNVIKMELMDVVKLILFHIGWICSLLFIVIGQKLIVNLEKEINPEKKGSVYDIKFQQKWFDSCDEAEKIIIYQAAYCSYKATTVTCIVLCFFCLVGSVLWGVGILPVCLVGVVWLVNTLAYGIKAMQLSRGK